MSYRGKKIQITVIAIIMIIQNSVFVNTFSGKGRSVTDTYEKIRELCEKKGIRLSTLAAGIGVRSSVFSELKSGRTKQLSVGTLTKLADYFAVPQSYFLDSPDGADDLQEQLFRKRKLLFDKSGKASAADLDRIIRIVDAIVGDTGTEETEG